MDLELEIKKYALQNAVKYKGKANPGSVIPKIIGLDPELKSKIKEIMPQIQEIVKDINNLSPEEQISQLQDIAPELLEEKKGEKKTLKDLEGADTACVMRFAPSPSGPMHIGHAATGSISSLYTDKYKGKLYFRIEDTNPSNIYPPAYDMLEREANWLFGNVTETFVQSDRMDIYYTYAKALIDKHLAYVCNCEPEEFKKYSDEMVDCPCRKKPVAQNEKEWHNMADSTPEGTAVLRFKTSMQHKNPAMRDFPLFRITDEEHPRQGKKYRVYPLMNMSVAVDDMEYGMTHIIRAKDHADNAKKQEYIFNAFEKPIPKTYFLGRLKFDDMEISASKTREAIEQGQFTGWDDIRLPFIEALKRRGYQPAAFKKFSEEIGISQVDKVFNEKEYFKTLNAFNKEHIESTSNRYFIVRNPVEIKLPDFQKDIELDLHPDHKKGGRMMHINESILIEQEDADAIKDGEVVRLIDLVNIKKEGNSFTYVSDTYEEFKSVGKRVIHWLPNVTDLTEIKVLMPDNTEITAKAEHTLPDVKIGDVVQFERFGFCRKDDDDTFWFGHK